MGTLGAALESINSPKKNSDIPKSDKIVMIHYSKLHTNKKQYRNEGKTEELIKQEIEDLAFELRAAGKILSPCTVRKIGTDEYEMIGGHHRRDAAILNIEKYGLKNFEFIPCIVETNISDVQAEYRMFSDNEQVPKTDWQIMHELERRKALIEAHPEEFPLLQGAGRIVDKLASMTNMSKSTVGEYLQIANNLSETAMDAFKGGSLNKSAAVAIASLSHTEQDKLIGAGMTKQKDIKAYKESAIEKTTRRVTITDTLKKEKSSNDMHEDNVPNFGTTGDFENESEIPNFGSDVFITSVNPDYGVDGAELEELKKSNEELEQVLKEQSRIQDVQKSGKCDCVTCKGYQDIAATFLFYGKRYCMNCLYDLLMDLVDTGVITLDTSNMVTNGIVIHS